MLKFTITFIQVLAWHTVGTWHTDKTFFSSHLIQWAVQALAYKQEVSQCITTSAAGNVYSNSMPCTRSGLTPSADARSSSVVSETSSIPAKHCQHLTTSNPEINLLHHILTKSFMKLKIRSAEHRVAIFLA